MGEKNNLAIKAFTLISFMIMITVNALANILPINGVGSGEVSDSYKNLFSPAGVTFSIWGLIYLMLLCFVLYEMGLFQDQRKQYRGDLLGKIGLYFSISCLANAAWLFSWHYRVIPLSMVLMLVILVLIIAIVQETKKTELTKREKFFIKAPFSVYFGWITIATIANATTLLVSVGWNRFGIMEPVWMIGILMVGLAIGGATTIINRDMAYGFVIIWAYGGILLKHISASGFAWQYKGIIITVIGGIIMLFAAEGYVLFLKRRRMY